MAYFVKKEEDGIKYRDFLTEEQIKEADALLKYLQDNFPEYTKMLADKYGAGTAIYFYHMGLWIKDVIEKHDIPVRARKYLFSEIASFAPDKERLRDVSDDRNPYYQAYILSQLDEGTVSKLSFNKWQSLLERESERSDPRIFTWIKNTDHSKITVKGWRNFLKLLHAYLKKIDTSVFEDNELYRIYDMFIDGIESWDIGAKQFLKKHPDSQKLKDSKSSNKWQAKYFNMILYSLYSSETIPSHEERLKWIEELLSKGMKDVSGS